jgi:hypothetical protein
MRFERLDNRVDHVAVRSVAAFDVDVGFRVGRPPFVRQAFERAAWIGIAQQRPGIAARGPLGEDVDRGIEPDRNRALIEDFAGSRVDISTAAGRDHPDFAFDQAGNESSLAVTKIALAVTLVNFRRREARCVLDRRIAVNERHAQPPREAAADGRLSNSHQPHQHNRPIEALDRFTHHRDYTAAFRLGKSAAMPRIAVLIVVIVLIIGALVFLSTSVREQPTKTIEVDVPTGNAH